MFAVGAQLLQPWSANYTTAGCSPHADVALFAYNLSQYVTRGGSNTLSTRNMPLYESIALERHSCTAINLFVSLIPDPIPAVNSAHPQAEYTAAAAVNELIEDR